MVDISAPALPTWMLEAYPSMSATITDSVCVPLWMVACNFCVILALVVITWASRLRVRNLYSQLEQTTEDTGTLAELFGSEFERMRRHLKETREDSKSLDDILESILQGGLPGFLELTSRDYWCVKTMEVRYTDQEGQRQHFRQSGYHVNCFVPGGARDIEVSFGVVGGNACMAVDRSNPSCPWIFDEAGNKVLEKFSYKVCPGNVKYEIMGPAPAVFISHVTEVQQPAPPRPDPLEVDSTAPDTEAEQEGGTTPSMVSMRRDRDIE